MSDFNDQKDTTSSVEGLLKSKYSDLIILSVLTLAFIMLIIISTAFT